MRGSHLPHAKFSLQSIKSSLRYAMGIMFGMFWFAFWVLSTQKCEVVNFPKIELACMHARPLRYLDAPYLCRAHTPCMHMDNVHVRHDVTRLENKCKLHHHNVIGICIPFMPCRE